MATDLERLVVQLSADIKKYENSLNKAMGHTNKRARSIENRFKRMNKSIAASYAALGSQAVRAFALIGGTAGAKNLLDSATRIENALKVAGLAGAELEKVYESLRESAQKNAAPLDVLVDLYGKAALAQKELGVTTDELTGFADNVALALRVAGTSSQAASGALLQLGQALGSGKVQAQEFTSILEGAPTIAMAAAAGLKEAGGSVAALRKLVVDGKVSSEAFFRAFEAGAPMLEEKVAGATFTLDQRLTNLQTSLIDAAKRFNESSKAAETFGAEIDRTSKFIDNLDFEHLIAEIMEVVEAFNTGTAAAADFIAKLGELSTLDRIGRGFDRFLGAVSGQTETVKTFFGGGLTVTSSAAITDRINDAFEGEIKKVGSLTSEAIKNSVLGGGDITAGGKGGRLAETQQVKPVSLDDFASPDGKSGSKGGKKRGGGRGANDYDREVEQIRERTAALQAETAAMSQVNPLVNDYGFALAKARAESDLLAAAQQQGLTITPQLRASIEALAVGYANASVAAEKLADSQDKARQTADEFKSMSKDIASGFISDLRSGASAADALSNALNKVLDKLIDIGLNSILGIGGGGGLLSLFGFAKGGIAAHGKPVKTFARGGVSNRAAIFGEAGPEAAVPLPDGKSIPVKFQQPSIPKSNASQRQNVHVTVGVATDGNGNLMPFVKSVSEQTVATASPKIVSAANQNVVPTMAAYQNNKAGAEWR